METIAGTSEKTVSPSLFSLMVLCSRQWITKESQINSEKGGC